MKFLAIAMLFLSINSYAHPNGTYVLDNNDQATVEFKFVGVCPNGGDLRGAKRNLTFSEAAKKAPYNFVDGIYVETYSDGEEVYVHVNADCTFHDDGVEVVAEHDSFGNYSMDRI